jgi:hypothetical protein
MTEKSWNNQEAAEKITNKVIIQPLIKKYFFPAKCCNSHDNSSVPLSAARIASMTFRAVILKIS